MKIVIYWLLISSNLFIGIQVGFSQSNHSAQPPKIIPSSPNVAALQRYGDIPVSPYTGVPNISIPLYEVKSGDINVPISVNYHASGIKVADEASRVGLGWSLNAGGMISRTIIGEDDFLPNSYGYHLSDTLANAPDIANGIRGDRGSSFNIQNCSINIGNGDIGNYVKDNYSFQPDVYSFNFLGHSGKFILKRNKEVILAKKEKISIRCLDQEANAWEIKTADGVTFLFEEAETYVDNENSTGGLPGTPKIVWYLTKIISATGLTVTFHYRSNLNYSIRPTGSYFESNSPVTISSSTDQAGPFPEIHTISKQSPGKDYKNVYLDKIVFNNGEIKFTNSTDREDIQGDVKVDKIQMYNTTPALIKEWVFTYGYFEGTGDNDFNEGTALHRSRRLKLASLQEQDSSGNALPPFTFSYNNEDVINLAINPSKTSFARDHWGYFNGKFSNTSLIPLFSSNATNNIVAHYLGVMGESRNTDPAYAQLFMLKQIKYPTGGRTVFEYESHDFDIAKSNVNDNSYFRNYKEAIGKEIRKFYSGNIRQEQPLAADIPNYILDMSDLLVDANGVTSKVDLEAFFRFDGSPQLTCLPSGSVYVTLTNHDGAVVSGPTDVASLIGNTFFPTTVCANNNAGSYYGATFKNTYNLAPGKYIWKLLLQGSADLSFIKDVSLKINYVASNEKQDIVNSGEKVTGADFAGGLRIKKIIDYDNVTDHSPRVKKYNYHYKDSNSGKLHSFGRRMSRPIYTYYNEKKYKKQAQVTPHVTFMHVHSLMRESDSNIPLNGSAGGSVVGYDQVDVLLGENGEFGKTVYQFENDPDIILDYSDNDYIAGEIKRIPRKMPVLGTISNEANGNIVNQADYKYEGGQYYKVKEIINTYSEYTSASNALWYGIDKRIVNDDIYTSNCIFKSYLYPSIAESRKMLTSTTIKTFDQNNNSLFISQTTEYTYNNSTHLQLESTTTSINNGDKKTILLTYPLDYENNRSDAALSKMKAGKFMHASVVTKKTMLSRNNMDRLIDGEIIKYQVVNDNILPQEITLLETAVPLDPAALLNYNPSSGSYPSQYFQKLKYEIYDTKGNLLQYTAQDGIVTSTIWAYNDAYPIAQVINAQYKDIFYTSFEDLLVNSAHEGKSGDKSKIDGYGKDLANLTNGNYHLTYWQKSGTAWVFQSNNISVIDGSYSISLTGQVDDVRFYPEGAQMTTYTYDPLIGMTSVSDMNDRITYYKYDGFGRLSLIRDHEGNILKKIDYNYAGQPEGSNANSVINLTYTNTSNLSGFFVYLSRASDGLDYTLAIGQGSGSIEKIEPGTYSIEVYNSNADYTNYHGLKAGCNHNTSGRIIYGVEINTGCSNITIY
ncbi:MAG: hypothetical protein WKF97_15945 [Chitinophagaceae bacterium]